MSQPTSGIQLYRQRLSALKIGKIYTRLPSDSFESEWGNTNDTQPTYQQWLNLLAQEARAISFGQGKNRLAILLGDSISMWFPLDLLPPHRLWLNQSISGDTTGNMLRRIPAFAQTRPNAIYILAGINDLKNGITDTAIINNHLMIWRKLKSNHPQVQLIVQSILPTCLPSETLPINISNSRINNINQKLATIAKQENVKFLDIYSNFIDNNGYLRNNLTTDGLHLNYSGYQVWRWPLGQTESRLALNRDEKYQNWLRNSAYFNVGGKTYTWITYTVQNGDNLPALASRIFGNLDIDYYDLIAIKNNLTSAGLQANKTIYIPHLMQG